MSTAGSDSLVDLVLCDGRYKIVDVLDESPFARTFVAETDEIGVDVMVRFAAESIAGNDTFRANFPRHAERLRLVANPLFTTIHAIGEHDRTPFVVSEYVTGGTLDDRRMRDHEGNAAPLDPSHLTSWIEEVASALDQIHAEGLVYRDLRPQNVLFDIDGRARLAEFALPYAVHQHEAEEGPNLTDDLMPVGAAEYMSPEMILDGICDGRGDQYALGILVYDCLCGRPPFHGTTRAVTLNAHTEEGPPRLATLGLKVPRPLEIALATALSKEPDERYPTCSDFAATLISAVSSGSIRMATPHSGDSIVAQAPADSAVTQTGSAGPADDPAGSDSWSADEWPDEEVFPEDREDFGDDFDEPTDAMESSSVDSSTGKAADVAPESAPATQSGGTPLWKRPFVVIAAVAIIPVVGALAYFGYELFLKPAEKFGATANFAQKKPGVPTVNPGRVPAVGGGPGTSPAGRSPAGGPKARKGAFPPGPLVDWMQRTKVTVDVSAESPIEAFQQVLATQEGLTLAVDAPALATLDVCGFRHEAKYEDAPLTEVVEEIGARVPGVCVAVTGESRGKLTTHDMATLAGWETAGLLDVPQLPSLGEAAEKKIYVDVAGKKVETALTIVATKAEIDLRIDETASALLQDVLPDDFYIPGTAARFAAAKLLQGRPIVLAYDPEFPNVLRATTTAAAESEGWRLLEPEVAGLETRLGRQRASVPPEALDAAENQLSVLFTALVKPAGAEGVVDLDRLQDEGLDQDVFVRLRQVAGKFGSSSGAGEEDGAEDPATSILGVLNLVLERHPEVVVVLDTENDRLVLTSAVAAAAEKLDTFPVADAVGQLVARRRAEAIEVQRNSLGQPFVTVEPGRYWRGAESTDAAAEEDERPRHEVRLTRPLLMSTLEVTQLEFALLAERNPSAFCATGAEAAAVCNLDTSRLPVENVTWFDAIDFCNRLSVREGLAPYYGLENVEYGDDGAITGATVEIRGGSGYRLPTEAEWEYAARSGHETPWWYGNGHGARRNSWFAANADGRPRVVGARHANGFGLHDVHGNVCEWVQDWYSPNSYPGTQRDDPTGKRFGTERAIRGGTFSSTAAETRSTTRAGALPSDRDGSLGFRVCRTPGANKPTAEAAE